MASDGARGVNERAKGGTLDAAPMVAHQLGGKQVLARF